MIKTINWHASINLLFKNEIINYYYYYCYCYYYHILKFQVFWIELWTQLCLTCDSNDFLFFFFQVHYWNFAKHMTKLSCSQCVQNRFEPSSFQSQPRAFAIQPPLHALTTFVIANYINTHNFVIFHIINLWHN